MAGLVTDKLNQFGPFGKYNGVQVVTNKFRDFSSGSNLGASAIMISGSHEALDGTLTLARGGQLQIASMSVGVIHEIGIASCESDNASTHICVLQR